MTILDKIIEHKRREVALQSSQVPIALLEKSLFFPKKTYSLKNSLITASKPQLICEFKRKSPSKGIINDSADVAATVSGYEKAGAAAVSVLTDYEFFGGRSSDLTLAANFLTIPVLRKEFICSEYQIIEAKALGADLILLIAAVLSKEEIHNFTQLAHSLGLETLLELHDEQEIEKIDADTDMIGINNRNLHDFKVDIHHSIRVADKLPKDFPKVSESGLKGADEIYTLHKAGFNGFLIGETFMKTSNPATACDEFIESLGQNI
jgi:indole-3-glycerol phosphate synthase